MQEPRGIAVLVAWFALLGCKAEPQTKKAAPVPAENAPVAHAPSAPSASDAAAKRAGATSATAAAAEAGAQEAPNAQAQLEEKRRALFAAAAELARTAPEALPRERHVPGDSLSDKMQRRIRFRLREVANAPIALRKIVHIPNDDGSHDVVATYEYSAYEACVRGYPNRKEGRTACLTKDGKIDRVLRACVRSGVVWAKFAPVTSEAPEDGGKLTAVSVPLHDDVCTVAAEDLAVTDLDGDGELEATLELQSTYQSEMGDREQTSGETAWWYYIFPATLAPARTLRAKVHTWSTTTGGGSGRDGFIDLAPLVELRDVNKDEKPDVVIYRAMGEYECNGEEPEDSIGEGEPNPCARSARVAEVYLYRPRERRWAKLE